MASNQGAPSLAALRRWLSEHGEEHLQELEAICSIPSPTFAEGERAAYVASRFRAAGLEGVAIDAMLNVAGRIPGRRRDGCLSLSAHLDTVFPAEQEILLRQEGDQLFAPGIGDNSAGVAALVTLARAFQETGYQPTLDLLLVANSREEGLGDLGGMKAFLAGAQAANQAPLWGSLVLDGALGDLIHHGIGSRRYRVQFTGPGGHSWRDAGRPNSIHAMAAVIMALRALPLSTEPKSTLQVGVVRGGEGINSIAKEAEMLIDVRSETADGLGALTAAVEECLAALPEREGVACRVEVVGNRPAGGLDWGAPFLLAIRRAVQEATQIELIPRSASTDANAAFARGLPAGTLGIQSGGGAHTPQEWLSLRSLTTGLDVAAVAIEAAATHLAVSGGPGLS